MTSIFSRTVFPPRSKPIANAGVNFTMKIFFISIATFIFGFISSIYVIVHGGFLPEKNYTRVYIENKSEEKISNIEIDYLAGYVSISNIKPGETRTIILSSSTEGEYTIRATFESGAEVSGSKDYYTSGEGGRKTISKKGIFDITNDHQK